MAKMFFLNAPKIHFFLNDTFYGFKEKKNSSKNKVANERIPGQRRQF